MTHDGVLVRDGVTADIGAVAAIYREAVLHGTGTFEIEPPDAQDMAARHARITSNGYPYLVASEGRDILGYAYANAYRDRPAYRFTVEDSIYVRPDVQGRGIGILLLRRLVAEAEARGFRQMIAVIGDSRNRGSIGLHRKAGFEPLGLLKAAGWKHATWLDVVLMQRALGPGDSAPPLDPIS